jgi:AraC-like DNA-binding protein
MNSPIDRHRHAEPVEMSHFLLMVDRMRSPLVSIDEQAFLIPEQRANDVVNQFRKIVFLVDADCEHEFDGGERVRCRSGDILTFPGPCRHRYWAVRSRGSQRVHAVRLLMTAARTDERAKKKSASRPSRGLAPNLAELLTGGLTEFGRLAGGLTPAVRELLHRFRDEAEQRPLGYVARVEAICTELIIEVLRQLSPATTAKVGETGTGGAVGPAEVRRRGASHLVERAREWLFKNHRRNLSLDDMAGELDVSPEHLARTFRRLTGETVFGYLQSLRLDDAKTLLVGSELTIAEVAAATGFSSLALFSRTFQKRFGLSPRRYRQRIWESAQENFVHADERR